MLKRRRKRCECGCGGFVKEGKKFIHGHNGCLNKGRVLGPMSEEQKEKRRKPWTEEQKEKLRGPRGPLSDNHIKNMKIAFSKPSMKRKRSRNTRRLWKTESYVEKQMKIRGSKEAKLKIAKRWENPVFRKKMSKIQKEVQGTLEARTRASINQKALWNDPQFKEKQLLSFSKGAKGLNKSESTLYHLLEKLYPNEYKYTGDFSFIINGKNPDFINVNGQKKCIELFGDYWHRNDNPQDRKDIFKEYGWDTLVIWNHELRNLDRLKFKLHLFHRKGV